MSRLVPIQIGCHGETMLAPERGYLSAMEEIGDEQDLPILQADWPIDRRSGHQHHHGAIVGLHQYCGGHMEIVPISSHHNAVVCRACYFRLPIATTVRTYGDLRRVCDFNGSRQESLSHAM